MSEPPIDPPDDTGAEQVTPPTPSPPVRGDGLDLARDIADGYRGGVPARRRPSRRRPAQEPIGKRAQKDDAEPVSRYLGKLIAQQGWEANLSAQRVFSDWPRIVGDEVAQHCRIVGHSDGQVEVEADSTAWATQLRLLAPRIVAKLNEELGDGSVVRLAVHGPKGPSWTKGKRTIRGARGPRDTYG